MSIVFYRAPMSSATPVYWALNELGVPFEEVKLDLAQGEQKKPEFLKLNPNGKVPTLVVDGTPMFEALAIMQYLGDRFGVEKKLWPATNDPQRLQALSWTTWSYVSVGRAVGALFLSRAEQFGKPNPAQIAYAEKELQSLIGILDGRLAQKPFLLSDQFSLADLVVSSVIGWVTMNQVTLDAHPHVSDWLARCQGRPSAKASWGQ
ncbi:MAG: glutathione S-transferase family protein [Polyangiales bacterium]